MSKIKETGHANLKRQTSEERGATGTRTHCWWECKAAQLLTKPLGRGVQPGIHRLQDLALPLSGMSLQRFVHGCSRQLYL